MPEPVLFFLFLLFGCKGAPLKVDLYHAFVYYLERLLSLKADVGVVHLNILFRQIYVAVVGDTCINKNIKTFFLKKKDIVFRKKNIPMIGM